MDKEVPPRELGVQVTNQGTYPTQFLPVRNVEFLGSSDCWVFPTFPISEGESLMKLACSF